MGGSKVPIRAPFFVCQCPGSVQLLTSSAKAPEHSVWKYWVSLSVTAARLKKISLSCVSSVPSEVGDLKDGVWKKGARSRMTSHNVITGNQERQTSPSRSFGEAGRQVG